VGHKRVVGWNLAAIPEEDVKAAEKVWMEVAKERAHQDPECTADKVEQEVAWCPKATGNLFDVTSRKIRICTKSKMWWNANIREWRKVLETKKVRRRKSEVAAKAKAEFPKSIRRCKCIISSENLQNLMGAEVKRAAWYTKPHAGMTVEAFTDSNGKQASTSLKKEEMLRCKSFPPNEDDQYYKLPPAASALTHITDSVSNGSG
jgi:hypothetical protein